MRLTHDVGCRLHRDRQAAHPLRSPYHPLQDALQADGGSLSLVEGSLGVWATLTAELIMQELALSYVESQRQLYPRARLIRQDSLSGI